LKNRLLGDFSLFEGKGKLSLAHAARAAVMASP
jgi:hypothetical protein